MIALRRVRPAWPRAVMCRGPQLTRKSEFGPFDTVVRCVPSGRAGTSGPPLRIDGGEPEREDDPSPAWGDHAGPLAYPGGRLTLVKALPSGWTRYRWWSWLANKILVPSGDQHTLAPGWGRLGRRP